MPLVFSALVPHPPILVPSVGKGQEVAIEKTRQAFIDLEQELYVTKPQIIIVISAHGGLYQEAFTVNAEESFIGNFIEFGDLTSKRSWIGTPELASKISHKASHEHVPVQLTGTKSLDYGTTIPLYFLTNHLPEVKILPIGFSGLTPKQHIDFGILLKECIMESDKRIAVIASGDLSHALTKQSPAGYHPEGKKFDELLITLLETRNTTGLANMDTQIVSKSEQCAYRSLLILLGILKDMNYTFKNLSYETPFGVGYLTGQLIF